MDLKDKVVVVSGASGAIGSAAATRFAAEGARVLIGSRSHPDRGEALVKELACMGADAVHVQADLSQPGGTQRLFDRCVEEFGTVDVLVNIAGATVGGGPIEKITKEDWLAGLDHNFFTAVLASQHAVGIMREHGGGRIINTTSVRGLEHGGRAGIAAYSIAKAALVSFTKTLAKEVAPSILVNAVAPGFVETPNYDDMADDLKRGFLDATPLRRFIGVRDVADAFCFLAKTDGVTGEVVVVDGGFSLKLA